MADFGNSRFGSSSLLRTGGMNASRAGRLETRQKQALSSPELQLGLTGLKIISFV
jgi:hypothetical protein